MGKEKRTIGERYRAWAYDHTGWGKAFEYAWLFLICTVSAFLFAFGFRAFIAPEDPAGQVVMQRLISGGISGVSQNIGIVIELIFPQLAKYEPSFVPILYFVLNIPIFFLAFKGIGVRFGVFTLINVVEVSLITNFLPQSETMWQIAQFVSDKGGGLLARALFAGVTTGMASAIALKFDFSDGGIDVIAYYFAIKKSTSVGKYSIALNSVTVVLFTILSVVQFHEEPNLVPDFGETGPVIAYLVGALYAVVYTIVVALMIDLVNRRNKKSELKVMTSMPDLYKMMLINLPHGATITEGKGAYTGEKRYIITMVISYYEVNRAVKLIMKEDPKAFIQVSPIEQVYGRFFIRPIK